MTSSPPDSPVGQLSSPAPDRPRKAVEGAAARLERPIERLVGSDRANPLPHAGTISVFLLIVVTISGIYITLFFEYGFDASYQAVADIDDHPVQNLIRSIHRYSSAAVVLTTLVHGWRIFVAGRFTAGRRHRWLTGVAALLLVWLAGVTGYLLVWDQRAQAIVEAMERVIGGFGWGAGFVVDRLIGTGAGSGSGLTVAVWFIHLLLTAAIGWFTWRHLRRTRHAWLPPRAWMGVMGAALVLVSIALPADLLDPLDQAALIPDMALDPFMLFILPPLLSDQAGWVVLAVVVATGVAAAVPWLLRDKEAVVVEIDAEACTGCELCVVDCPYVALEMRDRPPATAGRGRLAVLDPAACVGCGICVGSCAFGAIAMPGHEPLAAFDCEDRDVVIGCSRQARHRHDKADDPDEATLFVDVPCTGMLAPSAIGDLVHRGAASIQVVGCSAGDCSYGVGNVLTHERLTGERAPHVAARYADIASESYVTLGGSGHRPRETVPDPDADHLPGNRRSRVAAAAVVGASLVGVGAATLIPFGGDDHDASVRVVVDHTPGTQLVGQGAPTGSAGDHTVVVIEVDGVERTRATLPTSGGSAVGVVDAEVTAGAGDLVVTLIDGDDRADLYTGPARFIEGRRFLIEARDVPPAPGVAEGKRVFDEPRLGGCGVCHSTASDDDGVGPGLGGIATRAATTVPGLDGRAYLLESVIDPDAFIVPGYRAGQMLPTYTDRLSDAEIDSLVQYLLTLEDR